MAAEGSKSSNPEYQYQVPVLNNKLRLKVRNYADQDQFKAEYNTVQSKQVSLYKDDMPVSHSEKMVVVG